MLVNVIQELKLWQPNKYLIILKFIHNMLAYLAIAASISYMPNKNVGFYPWQRIVVTYI